MNSSMQSQVQFISILLLFLTLFSFLVCKPDHVQQVLFHALVDPGFTYYFADFFFVYAYNLPTLSIPPVKLHLFNRLSNNFILKIILLSIYFPFSESIVQDFYITLLDSFYSLVLRYNWLIQHNPLINWVFGSISFHSLL